MVSDGFVGRVAVIGAGSWGTTVASLIASNAPTTLWARRPEVADEIDLRHENTRYLSDMPLHPDLRASSSMCDVVTGADLIVMGVPSHGFRTTLTDVAPFAKPGVPVVSLAKGLEQGTNLRMTEVIADVLPGHPAGVLTGPNLSKEILSGHAAAAVIALSDEHMAERLQLVFGVEHYRVYTNTDVVGCEIAGALKNVIAVAAGIAAGLGTGDNTLATLITRGLSELTRLGVAMGAAPTPSRASRAWAISSRPASARRAATVTSASNWPQVAASMTSWPRWSRSQKASRACRSSGSSRSATVSRCRSPRGCTR
jgi:glycerol-3-phosphate dehydrogenase (NAD(P)+)